MEGSKISYFEASVGPLNDRVTRNKISLVWGMLISGASTKRKLH